jgi:hypothetical protein
MLLPIDREQHRHPVAGLIPLHVNHYPERLPLKTKQQTTSSQMPIDAFRPEAPRSFPSRLLKWKKAQ